MRYLTYIFKNFDQVHPIIQGVIYSLFISLAVLILYIGKGKYF